MDNPDFVLTKSTLPTTSSLTIESLNHLSSLYMKVLVASPQQKRHKISSEELLRLDALRYSTIPTARAARGNDIKNDFGHLTKPELKDLVSWKLARGVYRPTLPSLIAANKEEDVIETTKRAFEIHWKGIRAAEDSGDEDSVQAALKVLCELRGVGPATASLLLSVACASVVPFFSDELFYWTAATGEGVKLEKIKYNMKEYLQIYKEIATIRQRLAGGKGGEKIRADDIERAAYVVQKLQNPDVWAAVFDKTKKDATAGAKDGGKKKTSEMGGAADATVAELDEAKPPTNEREDLNEEEKDEEIEEKKEILLAHGAKVKSTGKKTGKRSIDAADLPPPRRSGRAKSRKLE